MARALVRLMRAAMSYWRSCGRPTFSPRSHCSTGEFSVVVPSRLQPRQAQAQHGGAEVLRQVRRRPTGRG